MLDDLLNPTPVTVDYTEELKNISTECKSISSACQSIAKELKEIRLILERQIPNKEGCIYDVANEQYKYANFEGKNANDLAKQAISKGKIFWKELVKAKICKED